MSDLVHRVAVSIDEIDIDAPGGAERVLSSIEILGVLKNRVKELSAELDRKAIEFINTHGDIEYGDVRYYVGTEKRVKPKDRGAVLDALMNTASGDMQIVSECLASDAFKPGKCREVLGDEAFDSQFDTTLVEDLKTGKPKKSLKKFDKRFSD